MTNIDWLVLILTLTIIVLYGLYKSRTTKDLEGYFLSNRSLPWYIVLLSIMGTQASAITFLSGPGQAYADGMRFVQYYFGLPLAMVVICITFVPSFNKLKVFTAYEFLEKRFDTKTRTLTSFLFLLQRGLSTGISIYAPSIILSSLFGWDIFLTNILMGGLLIIYTVTGGAKAVAYTQQVQLLIIFGAMFFAGYIIVKSLPEGVGFMDALQVGGKLGKLNVITDGVNTENKFDWGDKYNIWSGVIGGFFLALSYFGTDQSQVGRYLTAQNNTESRLGLLMNGLIKIPMQFFILLIGILVFSFYQFNSAPLSFNNVLANQIEGTTYKDSVQLLQKKYDSVNAVKKVAVERFVTAKNYDDTNLSDSIKTLNKQSELYRNEFKNIYTKATGKSKDQANDTNYVFLSFVKEYLPIGIKGLLIAVIFLAAWGSIAAALNSLSSSTVVDFHKRHFPNMSELQEYKLSKWYTLGWGIFCIVIAQFAGRIGESLIEAVNILGSLFYGVILGVFLIAFYFKKIGGSATFYSALIVEAFIVILFFNEHIPFFSFLPEIGFLWLNMFGSFGVILVGMALQQLAPAQKNL